MRQNHRVVPALPYAQHIVTHTVYCPTNCRAYLPDMNTAEYRPLELLATLCLNFCRDGSTWKAGGSGGGTTVEGGS